MPTLSSASVSVVSEHVSCSASPEGRVNLDCVPAGADPQTHRSMRLTIVAVNGMLSIKDEAKAETHSIRTMAAARRRSSGTIWRKETIAVLHINNFCQITHPEGTTL